MNPAIECKLNTVVNQYNYQEDFHGAISKIKPDRWKVFQMLPVADTTNQKERQKTLIIDKNKFTEFVKRHEDLLPIMNPEDNDAMTDSYIMIDPMGRPYQNDGNGDEWKYIFSEPLFKAGFEKARKQISFSGTKFSERYKSYENYFEIAVAS